MSDFTREQVREWREWRIDEREHPLRYRAGNRSSGWLSAYRRAMEHQREERAKEPKRKLEDY